MSVPLPGPGEAKLTRPDAAEVAATARGIASVVAPAGGHTDLQRMLLEALFPAMTEQHVDLSHFEPMSVDELAEALRPRDLAFRTRGVQVAPAGRAMAIRLADAMRRGAWCHDRESGSDSVDFLRQDWFALAPLPLDEVGARFGLRPKSPEATSAGVRGPVGTGWDQPVSAESRSLHGRTTGTRVRFLRRLARFDLNPSRY
jgi:hypothetical protein